MSPVIKHIPFFSPARNALSGQVFRFKVIDPAHTELVAFGRYLQIAELGNDDFAFSCSEDDWNGIWYRYFDMERDYGAVVSSIDPSDEYLAAAAAFGHGIRILRQDIWETVISYIISQRRSIPSITTSVERISRLWGQRIAVPELGDPFVKPLCDEYYSFPSVSELSSATLADISSTGVGYRAEYIMSALDDFRSGKLTCEMLESKERSVLIILIDRKGVMDAFLSDHPKVRGMFPARVDIAALGIDTLLGYAREYAAKQQCEIDEYGMSALESRVMSMQTVEHSVTLEDIRDIVDEAIYYASRKTLSTLVDTFSRRRGGGGTKLMLRDRDFLHY